MANPYYHNAMHVGGGTQQQLPPRTSPLSMDRSDSPSQEQIPRRNKRHYRAVPDTSVMAPSPPPSAPSALPPQQQQQQQQQQQPSPLQQHSSYPSTPNPTVSPYTQIVNGVNSLQIGSQSRRDVILTGKMPPIEDLEMVHAPQIPSNLTATSSATAQCPPNALHSTLNAIPSSNALLKKTKIPLALILEPFHAGIHDDPPLVEDTVIARCRRCNTYINPFVQFGQNSLSWRCNMCGIDNDIPPEFDWDSAHQQRTDRWNRLELNHGMVEYIATEEYTVRPPQPLTFVFVIDTSYQSTQMGVVGAVIDSILAALDKIPNDDGRARVAFITADRGVTFYRPTDEPEVLVVGDLGEVYLPRQVSDLVVNLHESRQSIETLLKTMKTMYSHTQPQAHQNCLGPALQAAKKLLASTGGKIVCYQTSLPTLGDGAIKHDQSKTTTLDTSIMQPSSPFYRTFATECAKAQVCADMFLFGHPFADVATLNVIPRFTGGQTHYFPQFNASHPSDIQKLNEEVVALLGEQIGLEAVMRTRCSSGILCQKFYGNCTARVPNIMALPNVPRSQSYCVELSLEEDIEAPYAYFQTALLYTTCFGERRIRVMNLCIPVTKSLSEVYANTDQNAIARVLCHQAIDKAANNKLKDGRELLSKAVIDICGGYAKEVMGSTQASAAPLTLCRELSLLPLLVLGLLKKAAFSDHPNLSEDIRAESTVLLRTLPMSVWIKYIHPSFYALHSMPPNAGTVDPVKGTTTLPPQLQLGSDALTRHGCYLINDGLHMLLWVGSEAIPALCNDLFGVPTVNDVLAGRVLSLPSLRTGISQRVTAIIAQHRARRETTYYPTLDIVKEDDLALRTQFLSYLVLDRHANGPTIAGQHQGRADSGMSYFQWLGFIRSKCVQ